MNNRNVIQRGASHARLLLLVLLAMSWLTAHAHSIRGITPVADPAGPTFNLYVAPFNISLPDGSSLHMWGYGDRNYGLGATHPTSVPGSGTYGLPQYPGPTLIVTEGQKVTINLSNYGVIDPVSIVITGHRLEASGGVPGLVTRSATLGNPVTYTFTASKPGTYIYHSLDGKNPGLHSEMGLVGVMIVRPADGSQTVYGAGTETDYDHEYLYLMTDMDPEIHALVEFNNFNAIANHKRYATVYLVNGRVYPDLLQGDFNQLFPHQPYESLAAAHPRNKILVRNVNAGRDSHPFHYHGENMRFVGRDGNMLSSDGRIADIGRSDNTINSAPMQSVDAIWTWTGRGLGWDIYGVPESADPTDPTIRYKHTCVSNDGDEFDDVTQEYCPDHYIALGSSNLPATHPDPALRRDPAKAAQDRHVQLPTNAEMTLGAFWSGSPYLGDTGDLPPGEGGLNANGGYFFVWHSHAEKELTTVGVFPGGSLSAVVVLPTNVAIGD